MTPRFLLPAGIRVLALGLAAPALAQSPGMGSDHMQSGATTTDPGAAMTDKMKASKKSTHSRHHARSHKAMHAPHSSM